MTTVTLTQAGFFIQCGSIGSILTLKDLVGGSSYTNGTYNSVPLTGGHGSGAQATVVVASNTVTSVVISSEGTGYVDGDNLSASNTNLGGTGSGFETTVDTVGAPPPTPPSTSFQITVGGPNSTGPLASGTYHGDGTGYYTGDLNGGNSIGTITTDPTTFMGGNITACAWQGNGPPGHGFVLAVNATLAQSAFTTLTVSAPASYLLTSASASTFDTTSFPGWSIWIWSSQGGDEFTFLGQTLTVTLT